MNKILNINIGGTISSILNDDNSITLSDKNIVKDTILSLNQTIDFEFTSPFFIHSENLNDSLLDILHKTLITLDFNNYIGIIITTGSDTLPYVSSFVSFICCNTRIPIVITASNYPINDINSNGKINLKSSIFYILDSQEIGVFVVYEEEEVIVYLASQLKEPNPDTDKFSTTSVAYGKIINNTFTKCSNLTVSPQEKNWNLYSTLKNEIIYISAYPCLNYDNITLNSNVKAILHSSYHSGTTCTNSDISKYSIISFIERCNKSNVDVYILSQKAQSTFLYTSKVELFETNVSPLSNILMEAALMKLKIAYNQNDIPAKDFMKKQIYFEMRK